MDSATSHFVVDGPAFTPDGRPQEYVTVKFGSVTVVAPKPSDEQVQRNIEFSHEALRRGLMRLITPGVDIPAQKDIPLYSADPEIDGFFIRELNGQIDRGILENGEFKVTG